MATTATAQAQQKFSNLRRRLDQLGYQQPLGIESLPLVEKLFADLIHTTESLKNAKLQLGQKKAESVDAESLMGPYKSDNARLIKENNELHMQLVKQKENLDTVIRGRTAWEGCLDTADGFDGIWGWQGGPPWMMLVIFLQNTIWTSYNFILQTVGDLEI